MRRILWLLCFCLGLAATGCLEHFMLDQNRIIRTGVHPRARQVENDVDWGPEL